MKGNGVTLAEKLFPAVPFLPEEELLRHGQIGAISPGFEEFLAMGKGTARTYRNLIVFYNEDFGIVDGNNVQAMFLKFVKWME